MLGLLWGFLCLALLWIRLGAGVGLHADALYLADLLQGLRQGQGLSRWFLPPAPSLFPDLGLLWVAGWGRDVVGAQRVFGLLMGAWLWIALARLLRRCFDLPVGGSRALAAAGLLGTLALTPIEGGLADWTLPGHHGAAWIASLSLWAWVLRQRDRPSSWGRTLGGAVLAGWLLASDLLFLFWGILPAAVLARGLRRETQKRLLVASALLLLVGWLARKLPGFLGARVAVVQLSYIKSRTWNDWSTILALIPDFLRAQAGLLLAAAVAFLLGVWGALGRFGALRALGWAGLVAVGASLALGVLMGSFSGRYLYPLLLPALLLPALVAARSATWSRAALLIPALIGLLGLATPEAFASGPPWQRRAQALDAFLGSRGLRWGWADYWHARPLRLLSTRGTVCLPMIATDAGVSRYIWMVQEDLFVRGAALERPQFVVLNGLEPAAVTATLGPPREVRVVEDLRVWLYQ
jgi:hypothetical protein